METQYENKSYKFNKGSQPDPKKVAQLEKLLDKVEKMVDEYSLFETLKQFNDKLKIRANELLYQIRVIG